MKKDIFLNKFKNIRPEIVCVISTGVSLGRDKLITYSCNFLIFSLQDVDCCRPILAMIPLIRSLSSFPTDILFGLVIIENKSGTTIVLCLAVESCA